MAAYNSAWEEYKNAEESEGTSREDVSHKIAWTAVKKKYEKNGKWKRKTR